MNTKELKACPWPGNHILEVIEYPAGTGLYGVSFFDNSGRADGVLDCRADSPEEAIDAWNTRAPVAGLTEEDVERIIGGFTGPIGESFDRTGYDDGAEYAALEIKDRLIALLRQQGAERSEHPQGPQRSEDPQGAERKWISLDECDWDDETPVYACFEERNRDRDFVKTKTLGFVRRSIKKGWSYHSVYVCKRIEDAMPPFTPTQTEE